MHRELKIIATSLLKNKWKDFVKTLIEEGNQVQDYLQKEFDLAQNNLSRISDSNVDIEL